MQTVRAARHQSREKPRIHNHYLKGSLYCGNCGEPLTFEQTRNHSGDLYDYFYCLGRQRLKNGCSFRAIQTHIVEALVADHWKQITLRPEHVDEIRRIVLEHMRAVPPDSQASQLEASERLRRLASDSQNVLEAYYADAIGTHELRAEQARIAGERAQAETELGRLDMNEQVITRHLDHCLNLLANAKSHYDQANDTNRRVLNQSVFEHIYVDDDEVIASDLQPAFRRLMSESLDTDLAGERKPDQIKHVRTKNLWIGPRGRERIPQRRYGGLK